MSDSQWQDEVGKQVRWLQIVVGGLIAGCGFFMVIVLFITRGGQAPVAGQGLSGLVYVAVTFGGVAFVAQPIISTSIAKNNRRRIVRGTWRLPQGQEPNAYFAAFLGRIFNGPWQPPHDQETNARYAEFLERTGDAGKLCSAFQFKTIFSAAVFESAAFFNLIVYMVVGSPLSLAVALGLLFCIAMLMPTRSRVVHWIEDQLQRIEQERQFAA